VIKEAIIIDGKKIALSILADLKAKIDKDRVGGHAPACLAIVLVGDDPASSIYVQNKRKAASEVGIETYLQKFDNNTKEEEILRAIDLLNRDDNISGIIVQLPLPLSMDKAKIIKSISPRKDVDGFHPMNLGLLYSPYEHVFVPCTAMGCLELIKSCCPNLTGKHIVIVGRSNIVGRPLAALLLKEDCSVTICHSKTSNLKDITRRADVVISAIGSPQFFTQEYFNSNAVVIDVGINRIKSFDKYKLVGDVDFENVRKHVKYITPVPGGVGPMTVAYLMINTYKAKFGINFYKDYCHI
jgi:methylenetetrahydrofolate dehydrogenase (NADP+) / methenyltetrahydrofolate cyclohydrolase